VNWAEQVVLGLLLGGIYVAVGLGFSLVWGVLNIVNLAYGALVMVGGYVTWLLFTYARIDPFAGIPVTVVVLFCLGYALQYVVINRIVRASFLYTFLITFGLDLVIVNVLLLIFKPDFRSVTTSYSGASFAAGPILVPYIRLWSLLIALALAAAMWWILNRTRIGDAIQAVGSDREAAQLVGINLPRTYALTFGLGAACAGVAGALIATYQAITPSAGAPYTLQAFVVVILGGLGRVSATVVGGMLFALVEVLAQSAPHLGAGYQNAIAFGILVLVLLLRPRGLLGRPT
jgi:branched-chain amino acid transport system permease protein